MNILLTTLNAKYIHSNLAIKYLYQSALSYHDQMQVREFTINNDDGYLFTELVRGQYDLICFSCYIWNIERILYTAAMIKKACPHISILLGGPEVSFEVKELMEANPAVDFVLAGEGEETYPQFLQEFCEGTRNYLMIQGLSFRSDGAVVVQEDVKPVDFQRVPFPYETLGCETDKVLYYESTRGCPYGCAYCLSCLEKGMRPLPLPRVKKELGYFLKQKVKQVKFIDRTFNYDEQRTLELIEFLITRDNGITNFHFELCGDLITTEFVQLLQGARPGLFQFEIGVQSTNTETLQACNRTSRASHMAERIRDVKALGVAHMHLDLIAGLPFEGYQSFARSFDDVWAMNPDQLQLGFLKVLKGTPFRQRCEQFGFVYRDRAPYEIISTKWISAIELVQLKQIEEVLDLYFNRGGFFHTISAAIQGLKDTPFAFFERLAKFYYGRGYQHRSHKKEDLYRIFYAFAMECEGDLQIQWQGTDLKKYLMMDMQETLNFDAIKKFEKKGWEISQ